MNLMARILLLVNSLWMRIKRSTSFGICVWNLCSYSYIRFGTMAKLVVSIFWGVALVWIADMRGEYGSFVTLITSMRSHDCDDRKLPMARFWPSAKSNAVPVPPAEGVVVNLPSLVVQDHLVDLYFTYAHPFFPVIHKGRFLREYSEW